MIQDIDEINVSIQDDNSINVSIDNDSISVSEATPTDIAEIMHNEEIRQENETQRIENENAREDYINDLKQRVLDGEFNGQDGEDGFSPTATVVKEGTTSTITITDKNGTTTAEVLDGRDGVDGHDGTDGRDGVDGHDGTDGRDGVDGEDGFSPSASVTKTGSVATITITDKSGTTTANIYDGSGGGGGIWGSITGNLSDQIDLQNALDGKQATIDSTHKLSSDLVDDTNNTNKFINSSAQTFSGAKTFSDDLTADNGFGSFGDFEIANSMGFTVFGYNDGLNTEPFFEKKLNLEAGGTTSAPINDSDIANKKYVDDNIPDISTKQDKIDSSHKLDADLVDDSTSANKFLTGGSQTIDGTKEFTSLPQYAFSTEPVLDNELTTKAYVDNNFKYQVSAMPTAGSNYKNKVYQYIGTTNANYTNGYFYKCVRSGTSPNYTYSWERLDVQPNFSGDYNDLSNKPTIPANTSDLNNDSGFIDNTVNNLTNYTLSSSLSSVATSGSYSDLSNKPTIPDELADLSDDSTHRVVTDTEKTTWSGKQDALVSGTNIKTINNTSILGSGNLDVGLEVDSTVSTTSTNPIENQAITNYVNKIGTIKQAFGDIFISDGTYTGTLYSHLVGKYIGNGIWEITTDGQLAYSNADSNYYKYGLSITKIGNLLGLNLVNPVSGFNLFSSYLYYNSNGEMSRSLAGYGPMFEYHSDLNRLMPGRIYNTSGSIGGWPLSSLSSGNYLQATIYLKEV